MRNDEGRDGKKIFLSTYIYTYIYTWSLISRCVSHNRICLTSPDAISKPVCCSQFTTKPEPLPLVEGNRLERACQAVTNSGFPSVKFFQIRTPPSSGVERQEDETVKDDHSSGELASSKVLVKQLFKFWSNYNKKPSSSICWKL